LIRCLWAFVWIRLHSMYDDVAHCDLIMLVILYTWPPLFPHQLLFMRFSSLNGQKQWFASLATPFALIHWFGRSSRPKRIWYEPTGAGWTSCITNTKGSGCKRLLRHHSVSFWSDAQLLFWLRQIYKRENTNGCQHFGTIPRNGPSSEVKRERETLVRVYICPAHWLADPSQVVLLQVYQTWDSSTLFLKEGCLSHGT